MQWSRHLSVDQSYTLGRSEFSLCFCRKGRRCAEKFRWNPPLKSLFHRKRNSNCFIVSSWVKGFQENIKRNWKDFDVNWNEALIFLFCSNQVSFPSKMKLYTAKGKSYLESILKWSRLEEFGSMYISIFNTLVTLRTSASGWMALCNDGFN